MSIKGKVRSNVENINRSQKNILTINNRNKYEYSMSFTTKTSN